MSFDDLKPQPPRTGANSRDPAAAIAYAEEALTRSRIAAAECRTVLDVAYGDDEDQALDIYLPDDEAAMGVPVLLFFHGGAWRHGYKEWNAFMAPVFVGLPAIFVSVGYRIAPVHRFPAQLDDALAALAWVHRTIAEYGGDPERIALAGWSAGGALAALATLRRDAYAGHGLPPDVIKSCHASSAMLEIMRGDPAPGNEGLTYGDFFLGNPGDDRAASPLHHVAGNNVPFFISHGSHDFPQVIRTSDAMITALRREGCHVVHRIYEGLDHYANNLSQGDEDSDWVGIVRGWLAVPPP